MQERIPIGPQQMQQKIKAMKRICGPAKRHAQLVYGENAGNTWKHHFNIKYLSIPDVPA